MGKNHRHKKQLKSEKAKVKLKSTKTKFLPKGLNVTDTSFKVKPIVLQEQLKEKSSDVPLSKRKLNVKELLTRLKHYNENVRSGACEELTEFITVFSKEIIQSHLSEILQTASTLMQDLSSKVRKACAKVLGTLLEYTPASKISPFFNYLLRNLCCAITNIDKNIQEDSLLFLDVLLKHTPGLVAENCSKILQNFFALVSKLRSDSNVGRTLTVNLGSKMTSVKWRIKVLSKLYQILNTVIENKPNCGNSKKSDEFMLVDGNKTCVIPLYKKNIFENYVNFNERDLNNKDKGTNLSDYVANIIPLLYETWMEVIPVKSHVKPASENTILNEENVSLLACILNISYLLYGFIQSEDNFDSNKNIFQSTEGKKFFQHLMQQFPYCCQQKNNKSAIESKNEFSKIIQFDIEPKLVKENLIICRLFTAIFLSPDNNVKKNNIKNELKSICIYLSNCVNNKNLDNSNVKYYLEILKSALGKESLFWHQNGIKLDEILENAIKFYKSNKKLNTNNKIELFDVLNEVVTNKYISRYPIYESWLSFLPTLLCQSEITEKEVQALLKFSSMNNEHFSNAFLANLSTILGNLNNLKIDSKEMETKRNILNILFFLPKLEDSHLNVILNFCQQSNYGHLIGQILKLRAELKNNIDGIDLNQLFPK